MFGLLKTNQMLKAIKNQLRARKIFIEVEFYKWQCLKLFLLGYIQFRQINDHAAITLSSSNIEQKFLDFQKKFFIP